MKKLIFSGLMAATMISAIPAAHAAEGEHYQGIERGSVEIDRSHTGSIGNRDRMQVKTSRDNRLPFDSDRGSYYEGAQRPR